MPTTETLKSSVQSARPVLERLANDDKFRRHVTLAFQSARHAYDELSAERRRPLRVADRIATDGELQDDLRQTIQSLADARRRARKVSSPPHTVRRIVLLSGLTLGLLYAAGRLRAMGQEHAERVLPDARDSDAIAFP